MSPSPHLLSDQKKAHFIRSISVLSNRVSKLQESEYGIDTEIASLHNILSFGFEVISNQVSEHPSNVTPQIANKDHLLGTFFVHRYPGDSRDIHESMSNCYTDIFYTETASNCGSSTPNPSLLEAGCNVLYLRTCAI